MSIGYNIKKFRQNQNLRQSELAKKAGISRVAVGNYERNERIPNAEILLRIAEALNVSLLELLDLAPDDHNAIADIANKTHTHPAYIRGETKEKDFKKWNLEIFIKELDYKKLKYSVSIYPNKMQDAIIKLWSMYIYNMFSDWYDEDDYVAVKDIDKIFFLNTVDTIFDDFIGYLDYIVSNYDKIELHNMTYIYDKKSKALNAISSLFDTAIHDTFLNKGRNEFIYFKEIIEQYGNKEET